MTVTGIIAEFNPLHNGHKYLINKAKENSDYTVCVLSGDFVQRGDSAVFSKQVRTESAVLSGIDLVIELPVMWSMASAEKFSFGAVSLLKSTGIVNRIAFGVKDDNLLLLKNIADFTQTEEFKTKIKSNLNSGIGFAAIRETVISEKFSTDKNFLKDGNNILAIEYLKSCKRLSYFPEIFTVKRLGALHGSMSAEENFSSATYIRNKLYTNSFEEINKFVPNTLYELYKISPKSDISRIYSSILFKLRSCPIEYFSTLPDLSEGIENRLYKAVQKSPDMPSLINALKTKRYPESRIRRLILNAALEIQNTERDFSPPYIRVLGFNDKGTKLIKEISKVSSVPIIINSKQISALDGKTEEIFKKHSTITDLYNLTFRKPLPCGSNITYQPVKIDTSICDKSL